MQGSDNMEKLPLFKLTIKEDETAIQEVNAIALVDVPAINETFFAFSKQIFVEPNAGESESEFIPRCIEYVVGEGKDQEQAAAICYSKWENKDQKFQESYSDYPKETSENERKLEQIDRQKMQSFSVVNSEERIVVGPAMIPDMPIYRRDETGEYYVFFDKKTIETIALKFYSKGFQQSANEMHMKPIEGVTFFQSWIADESKGIPKMKQFEDLPDGTWFLGAKIMNDETWAKVKDGTFRGFSVEGMFDMTEIKMRKSADEIIYKLREMLKDL